MTAAFLATLAQAGDAVERSDTPGIDWWALAPILVMIGGAMVGLQATVFKTQLGPLLNGWTNYETWVPSDKMLTPEVKEFLNVYQSRAAAEGVDPLGYYLGTWGYAYLELLGNAIGRHTSASRQTAR